MTQLKPAERTAYHEAGHVLAFLFTGNRFIKTCIKEVEGKEGKFEGKVEPVKGQQPDPTGVSIILVAGQAAECVLTGEWPKEDEGGTTSIGSDGVGLTGRAPGILHMLCDQPTRFYISWLRHCAWLLLKEPVVVTPMLHAIANELVKRKELTEQEVVEICRQVGKDTGKGLPRWQVCREGE